MLKDLFLRFWIWIAAIALISAIALLVFWCNFVNFVDVHEYGFTYDKFAGKIEPLGHTGWVVRNPFHYDVHSIDTRPYQVSISANARILNAKLVRFNPAGIDTFVNWHGRSAGDNWYSLTEILKCYAFDRDEGRDCPFLEVLNVLAPNQTGQSANQ